MLDQDLTPGFLPVVLDRDVARRAAAILREAPCLQDLCTIFNHIRIATEHDLGSYGIQLQAQGIFQRTVFDSRRDPTGDGAGTHFSADEGLKQKTIRVCFG